MRGDEGGQREITKKEKALGDVSCHDEENGEKSGSDDPRWGLLCIRSAIQIGWGGGCEIHVTRDEDDGVDIALRETRRNLGLWWKQFETDMNRAEITWEEIAATNPLGDNSGKKLFNKRCRDIVERMARPG